MQELLAGFKELDTKGTLEKIGTFEFTLYFMKKQATKDDRKRFFYKDFKQKLRNDWLKEHVGIKIFRDGFRVRPYGEATGTAMDWLGLDTRQAASPAGVAKESGGFKVRGHNISGVVHISRISNLDFADKSSREGIQENQTFDVFKQLLISIIDVFEKDRSHIARELDALYKSKNPDEKLKQEAQEIKKKRKKTKSQEQSNDPPSDTDIELDTLTEHSDRQDEQIKELLSEQKLLRALASNGTMLASFIHELNGIRQHIVKRPKTLREMIKPLIPEESIADLAEHHNPYIFINDIEKNDQKLLHWMQFALGSIQKDRRQTTKLFFDKYIRQFKKIWDFHLTDRMAELHVECNNGDAFLEAFEIDFDIIFNNLLINSIDAFQRKDATPQRNISIDIDVQEKDVVIIYKDSGPGIAPEISDPSIIFDIFYSTKRDEGTGEQIGSGLGMWLVKSTLDEYKGNIALINVTEGFGAKITIPHNNNNNFEAS